MDLEAQLAEQLAEQQEALQGVQQLLEADPGSEETAALLEELQAGKALGWALHTGPAAVDCIPMCLRNADRIRLPRRHPRHRRGTAGAEAAAPAAGA